MRRTLYSLANIGFAEPIVSGLLMALLTASMLTPEIASNQTLWPRSHRIAQRSIADGQSCACAAVNEPVVDPGAQSSAEPEPTWDVVIYGGTSGGVVAAVQARTLGLSTLLIEPSEHLGGLTSGGLGATDIGNKGAIGGLSREFYRRIKQHYQTQEAWQFEQASDYRDPHRSQLDDAMWTFEPRVAEAIFDAWIVESGATLWKNERLLRSGVPGGAESGVVKERNRIVRIVLESGKQVQGRVFIDATYEGDLMAEAGVSFVVGRESNATYGETLNGVQTQQATKHQLQPAVDPYRVAGDPSSGLLPGIDPTGPGEEGAADHRVQAYCLRMCVTDVEANRIPFAKPESYDESLYELLLRNFEAGETREPWNPIMMPNRKTDANNNHGVSSDWIGQSYSWPEASYEERQSIYQAHRNYQEGLMWTLANHPRVPEPIRRSFSRWGNCKDEFTATEGWSHQLYVREARRMLGSVVMTQHHCQGRERAHDPIGLAAYTMDSHNVQRYVDADGHARNEGDVQVGGFPPYPIAYGAITPREGQCSNLLVPVALSASHIAYGSIRMEPVFMVLGQSAATAAQLAIEQDCSVQAIDVRQLQSRLLADGQVLEWVGAGGVDVKRLPGIVIDDSQAIVVGDWTASTSITPFVASSYRHDNDGGRDDAARQARAAKLPATATFDFGDALEGRYRIAIGYVANPNRATNVPITVAVGERRMTFEINQRVKPETNEVLHVLGEVEIVSGEAVKVIVSNHETDGYVVIDSAALIPVNDQ